LIFIEKREPFKVLVNQHLESGFGVVLNNPLTTGGSDFIDFEYECGCLYNWLGFFYVSGNTSWYPMNIIRDPATFHLSYIYPVDYRVVSSGENISKELTSTGVKSAWLLNYPSCGVSFNIGKYYDVRLFFENLLPIEVFTHMPINIPEIGADMLNSLAYFSDLFGVCPFEIIKVADAPGGSRGSSPGLENLNWDDLIRGTKEGPKRMANQWWIHTLRHESYKDEWIVEGLSNYCSFMYFEKSKQRYLVDDGFMKDWRKMIFYGKGAGSKGSQAGPMILGKRLNSSKSKDYDAVVGRKSAYIFHMLRYLLHDYKTDSDDAFIAFLRDLLDKYRDRPITTAGLQTLLEEHTQTDMTWFFDQWVYGIDIPTYTFSYDTENTPDGQFQVTCHVKQEDVPDDFKMVVPMTVVFEGNQFAHLKYWIDQPEMDIQLPPLPMKPKKIDFNTYDAVLCRVRTQ
jgi:hypothetical protein